MLLLLLVLLLLVLVLVMLLLLVLLMLLLLVLLLLLQSLWVLGVPCLASLGFTWLLLASLVFRKLFVRCGIDGVSGGLSWVGDASSIACGIIELVLTKVLSRRVQCGVLSVH